MNPTPIVNFSRNRRQELADLVESALRSKLFPGMELLVARGDEALLHEAWGMLEVGPEAPSMRAGTVFDIASLTKPIATATLLLVPTGVQTLATQFWAYAEQGVSFGAAAPYAAAMIVMSAVPAYLLGQWFDRVSTREPGNTTFMEAMS